MKQTAKAGQSDTPFYFVSYQVWLFMANLTLPYPIWKLIQKWIRPYHISTVLPNAVKLVLPASLLIHPVINISWVKLYYSTLKGQPSLQLDPIVVTEDCHEEHKVDYIAASHVKW